MQSSLRLGTRASPLALTQSRLVARLLERAHPGLKVELIEISTTGDRIRAKALASFGGTGVFTKELETALRENRIDIAVHSLKDLPTRLPAGLVLGAIVGREDVRDVAVLSAGRSLAELPAGSVIGSGSPRRRAQLKAAYPHLAFAEIRGNVETRIRKVAEGRYAGTILARAGLKRLKLMRNAKRKMQNAECRMQNENLIFQILPLSLVLPAPGQGALAVECRAGDRRARNLLKAIHDANVERCVTVERALLQALGGGCQLPLGALAAVQKLKVKSKKAKARRSFVLRLRAILGHPGGSALVRCEIQAPLKESRALARRAARDLLANGGREIIARLKAEGVKVEVERMT